MNISKIISALRYVFCPTQEQKIQKITDKIKKSYRVVKLKGSNEMYRIEHLEYKPFPVWKYVSSHHFFMDAKKQCDALRNSKIQYEVDILKNPEKVVY